MAITWYDMIDMIRIKEKQEAFEKCWAHSLHCQSPGVASRTPAIAIAHAACDVHNDDNDDDDDDNAWQRGPLWPHGMDPINKQIQTTVKQLLVMVKSIFYTETIALIGTGVDFGKGLGRSKPWCNYCGSGWRKETVETRGRIHNIAKKPRDRFSLRETHLVCNCYQTATKHNWYSCYSVKTSGNWLIIYQKF